jgi:hypothetical protein
VCDKGGDVKAERKHRAKVAIAVDLVSLKAGGATTGEHDE